MYIFDQDQLIERLKAQLFIFEEEFVDIVLLADIEPVTFMGNSFKGGKKSTTISVPRYYANWLFNKNKARFTQSELYPQLLNAFKQQAPSFKLQPLKENLLLESLSFLENYNNSTTYQDLISDQEHNRIQETFFNLSQDRLKKILRDITLNDYKRIERYLDDLEKPILAEIFNLLSLYLNVLNLQDKV
jgi:hypothetical protein